MDIYPRLTPVKEQLLRNLQHWVALDKVREEVVSLDDAIMVLR